MDNHKEALEILIDIFDHIENVEEEIKKETKIQTLALSKFLEEKRITPSVEVLENIQYQDILSQQLSSTTMSIKQIKKDLKNYINSDEINDNPLRSKLKAILEKSREEKKAFKGGINQRVNSSHEEIEFF